MQAGRAAGGPGAVAMAGIVDDRVRHALLVAATLLVSWLLLAWAPGDPGIPWAWPASGVMAGTLLLARRQRLGTWLTTWVPGLLLVHLAAGLPLAAAVVLALAAAAEAVLVRRLVSAGPASTSVVPSLLEDGDVSRVVRAAAAGSALVAAVHAVLQATGLLGAGSPGTAGAIGAAAVAVLGTHAAALIVALPLFLRTPDFPPLASANERAVQWGVALGTTVVVMLSTDVPPLLFVVMPMFAWLGFRGTLRESTLLLAAVAVVTTALTAAGVGPVVGLETRYDLAPGLASGFLQLFLIDCGLILLPLSVSLAQQRHLAAEVATGRATLERLVASATGTAIIATDPAGRVVLFNPGAARMLGLTEAEALGGTLDRFHPDDEIARHAASVGLDPADGPRFVDVCRRVAAGPEPRRLWRFRRGDGTEGTMLLSLGVVPDADGGLDGYLATAEDVTDREQAREAMAAALEHRETAMRRLEELDRTKDDFVSTVSHELRTPIANIVGYTEMLEEGAGGELTPTQRDFVSRVSRNSRRLLVLVEDLLTLARIESSDVDVRLAPTDLREVVAEAQEALAPSLRNRDLAVALDLPAEGTDLFLEGDADQLARLLLNLLTNAVKFTPDGGQVGLSVHAEPERLRVVVSDDGHGIPEDEQQRLFTRFFRASTAGRHAVQGTGLGLAIVRSIVTQHRGSVDLRSVPGQGTAVTVVLPRRPGTGSPGRPDEPGPPCPAPPPAARRTG